MSESRSGRVMQSNDRQVQDFHPAARAKIIGVACAFPFHRLA